MIRHDLYWIWFEQEPNSSWKCHAYKGISLLILLALATRPRPVPRLRAASAKVIKVYP